MTHSEWDWYLEIFADYQPILELVELLIGEFILPDFSGGAEGLVSEAVDKILQLMLCVLDGIFSTDNMTVIPRIASQWAPVFQLRSLRYPTFKIIGRISLVES